MGTKNPLNAQKLQSEEVQQASSGAEKPIKSHLSRGFNEKLGEAELLIVAMTANRDTLTPSAEETIL